MPNNSRVDDAHRGRIAAESEGSQNGRISKSDSPLTSFPPIDDAMEVIRNASTAVADCRIASCLKFQSPGPILYLPITNEDHRPRARPL